MSTSAQVLRQARTWHRKVASALFTFFLIISCSGVLLGWKNLMGTTIYKSSVQTKKIQSNSNWLPLDSLKKMAVAAFKTIRPNETDAKPESMNARMDKDMIRFTFSNTYNIQLNANNGELQSIDKKAPEWIIKLHDGELLDDLLNIKNGGFKKTYTSIIGLAFFFLTLSGFWMWFKPKQQKNSKKDAIAQYNKSTSKN